MGHTYTAMHYHIIFSTKNRVAFIENPVRDRLYEYIGGIVRGASGALLGAGGTPDHVHLLVTLPPTPGVADAVRDIKANSSKWIHDEFAAKRSFGWQTGYAAFSVSHSNTQKILAYIDGQAEYHRRASFEEEYIAFLERHGIEYDRRYVFD